MSNAVPNRLRLERPAPRVEPTHVTAFAEWLPTLRAAWRVAQQYPADHPQVRETLSNSLAALTRALEHKNPLTCVAVERALSLDGLALEERRPGVTEFSEALVRSGIRAVTMFQGVNAAELSELIGVFIADPRELFERGGGARELVRKRVMKIRATAIKHAEVTSEEQSTAEASATTEDRLRKLGAVTADRLRLTGQLSPEAAELAEPTSGGEARNAPERFAPDLIDYLNGQSDELSDQNYVQLLNALDQGERLRELLVALVAEQFQRGDLTADDRSIIARTIARLASVLRERSPGLWDECKGKLAGALALLGEGVAAGVLAATLELEPATASALSEVGGQLEASTAAHMLASACAEPDLDPQLLSTMFARLSGDGARAESLAALVQDTLHKVHGAEHLYGDTLEPIFVELMTAHMGGDAGLEGALLTLRTHKPDASRAAQIHADLRDLLDQSDALSPRAEAVVTLIELLEFETDPREYASLLDTTRGTVANLLTDREFGLVRELLGTVRAHAEAKIIGVKELAHKFSRELGDDESLRSGFIQLLFHDRGELDLHAVLGLLDDLAGDVMPIIQRVLTSPATALAAETRHTPMQCLRLRKRCVQLLVALRDERGWTALGAVARQKELTRESVLLRREAIQALGQSDCPATVECLSQIVQKRTWFKRGLNDILRAEAANALAVLAEAPGPLSDAARTRLAPLVRDANPGVRAAAARVG